MILENITSNTYKVSLSNKESGNEPILEDKADHIDSENEIVRKFEHLQQLYKHLTNHPINQSTPLAMINVAMRLLLPKDIKLLNLTLKTQS